jgi:hypothetical protein
MTTLRHIFYGGIVLLGLLAGCQAEKTTYEGPDYILFSADSHTLGILDSEEWFEIPISATRTANEERTIGVEVVASESSAIEGLHYILESNTLTIPKGELTTAVRIKGLAENIDINSMLSIKLRLVIDPELVWDAYGIESEVLLQKCCPFDINNFTGYAKITSTWTMQYMNAEARLVRTERDPEDKSAIIVKDMFYDGYDIRLRLNSDDRLNPTVTLAEQVLGTTGEAFGTIYGNGKLMMAEPTGYTSYYGTCENFLVLYSMMYVDGVGVVGTYVNIFEWISDLEAERIMREGF